MPHNRPVKKGGLRKVGRVVALILPLLVVGFLGTVAGSVATGFVRVPPDDPMTMFLVAEYRPGK